MNIASIPALRVLTHLLLALGGSILVLAGLFYAVSQVGNEVNPERLFEIIRNASRSLLLVYIVTMVLGILLRAWRYQVLLRASAESALPTFKDMSLITAVRNMTVDLLPARIGELVFVALLRARSGTHLSSGLSALFFATILDVLVLAPVTILIGLWVGFPNRQPYLFALIALVLAGGMLIGFKIILPRLMRLLGADAKDGNKILARILGFARSVNDALQSTLNAGVFWKAISLTLALRFFKYTGLLSLYYGLTQTTFPSLAEMEALKVLGSMIASEMTASLPIPALMSFGTWEMGGMTLLAYFGAMPSTALLTMLGVHIQTQALDYGIGLAALMALWIVAPRSADGAGRQSKWKWLSAMVFIAGAIVLAVFTREQLRQTPADSGMSTQQPGRVQDAAAPSWLRRMDGFIVWSSNRSGIHNIWMMSLPDRKIRQLTDTPFTENLARISPDGKKVVFARSHKEWQSLRDDKPWDIWILDIETGKQQRVAKWGMAPSWSPDGSSIIFKRDPGKVMEVDLATLKERIYYESGKDSFMKSRVNISTPSVGKHGRLAFTYRNHGQPTNVIRDENGKFTVVHRDSCQVMWAPSGKFTTYVQKGGKQTNQIMRFDPDTNTKTRLLDLPGDLSHEYFPKLSQDERYMVFAASGGGHEHDIADYEIFLWPVGADASEAIRLTYNPANDSWPDIWLR